MTKRTTITDLRDRVDSLALTLFATSGSILNAIADIHPDPEEFWDEAEGAALGFLVHLRLSKQKVFTRKAVSHALSGVSAVFAARPEREPDPNGEPEGGNDNEPG